MNLGPDRKLVNFLRHTFKVSIAEAEWWAGVYYMAAATGIDANVVASLVGRA